GTNIEDGNKKTDLGIKKEKKQMDKNMNKHGRLRSVTASEKKFLDDAVCEATKVKGKNLTKEERRKVLCVAREQICSQRKANQIKSEKTKARHAVVFEWKRPDSFRR
ncbi:TPA: hypothetical protein J1421_004501, partial [Escherichia coli]|nr:hypothetical protein [Escherichia coli]